jgi:hypothetical protein
MVCIPNQLSNEILKKIKLVRNPKKIHSFLLACQKREKEAIEKNAQIESYRIENPHCSIPHNVPRNNRNIKNGIKNIQNAFRWGKQNFNPENIDESFIRNLAYQIMPCLYEGKHIADYRDVNVLITGSDFMPPYPWKVENMEIPQFFQNIKEHLTSDNIFENMETAFYAHFNIVRIHPFLDGNGRTARTFQDILLDHYGIPLPVIEAGERMTYYQFLEDAVCGYKDRNSEGSHFVSEGEKKFYTYMAGKVNVSLDKVLNSCK